MNPWMGASTTTSRCLAQRRRRRRMRPRGHQRPGAQQDQDQEHGFAAPARSQQQVLIIGQGAEPDAKQMKGQLDARAGPGEDRLPSATWRRSTRPTSPKAARLTYAVDSLQGWPHGGHGRLRGGERSRLADFASDVLTTAALPRRSRRRLRCHPAPPLPLRRQRLGREIL